MRRREKVTTNPLITTPTHTQFYIMHSSFDNWREWDYFLWTIFEKMCHYFLTLTSLQSVWLYFFQRNTFVFSANFRSVVFHSIKVKGNGKKRNIIILSEKETLNLICESMEFTNWSQICLDGPRLENKMTFANNILR